MKSYLLLLIPCIAAGGDLPVCGFPPSKVAAELKLEERAKAVPQSAHIRDYILKMSEEPHEAGSPRSKEVAEYALGLLRQFGLAADIEVYEALMPRPVERTLEMTAPVSYRAGLKEVVISSDKDSGDAHQLPLFNAYSADGDVTAPLVYVNYGVPEDYAYLEKQKIDVKGKIVIARYGASWRGVKPKLAYDHGAVGCIIYSDPRDDGYFQGDVYPKGPFRPSGAGQRGSTVEMALYPGDPLSPGWASEPGSRRLRIDEVQTLQKVPVLPISADDARPLLEQLGGPVAPEKWRGALPMTYHVGPGPAQVHLRLKHDWSTRPLYNVVARIPGSEFPDEWVIYGNHHDAWVNGAGDPLSGAAVVLETGRSLGALVRSGWRPKRTILLALWDGEEYGLLGSTEWVEKHMAELQQKCVAYLNTDMYGRGTFGASGSPALLRHLAEVARDTNDPNSGKTILGDKPLEKFEIGAPGSGSDYAAFVHHAGVASINAGFGGPGLSGTYHSIYDSFDWYSRFGDPGFKYGVTLTQVMTTSILRLAEAPLVPYEFGALGKAVDTYIGELEKLAGSKLDSKAVRKEANALKGAAANYERRYDKTLDRVASATPERLSKVNLALLATERAELTPEGLPRRDWFKNKIYAPGVYTGYAAKSLPGIREAAEAGHWDEAHQQAEIVAGVLRAMRLRIEEAEKALKGI